MKLRGLALVLNLMIFTFLMGIPLFGQEAEEKAPEYGWKNTLVGGLNFTQNSFDNWAQGGENASAWQLNLNGKAVNSKEKYNWDNSGKIAYGRNKIAGLESRKSVDEIKADSVFTYLWGVYVNPYVAASGETQFTAGYDYPKDPEEEKVEVSNFLDPGYFTQSAGVGYEPVKEFKTRLGFAVKETITMDHNAPYADDPDTKEIEKIKVEPGMESVTDFSKSLFGGILMTSKLEIFSNFKGLDEIDVKWDNIFSAKISEYINVSFNIKLFYDRDISVKRQLKQSLSAGLTYTFL